MSLRKRGAADTAQSHARGAEPSLVHRLSLTELGRRGQGGARQAAIWLVLAMYVFCPDRAPCPSLTMADFSNVLSKSQIEDMASVDELEVVKEVQVCCL